MSQSFFEEEETLHFYLIHSVLDVKVVVLKLFLELP